MDTPLIAGGLLPLRTERGLGRLVTFLDAVVAIAITLLVLPLVNLLGDGSQDHDLGALLAAHQAQFGSFLLSFVVIATAWLSHHRLIERVGAYDEAFLLLNLAWVLTVVVLPFSAQVIADFQTQRLSVGIYVGTIALNSALGTALALLVHRRPTLRRGGDAGHGSNPLAPLVTTGLAFLALVVGVALPAVNFYALLLLLLSRPLTWLIRHVHPQDLIRRVHPKTER
ncbi:TMEM175 family protein [Lapillicoccus sp.]|uniref:TMEM175 family protein n=1 Tax=Lapillicoccus sp. TaxID=1909287 RepID=UPI003264A215